MATRINYLFFFIQFNFNAKKTRKNHICTHKSCFYIFKVIQFFPNKFDLKFSKISDRKCATVDIETAILIIWMERFFRVFVDHTRLPKTESHFRIPGFQLPKPHPPPTHANRHVKHRQKISDEIPKTLHFIRRSDIMNGQYIYNGSGVRLGRINP